MNQILETIHREFTQFWGARQPRERQILMMAAGFLLLFLIYMVGIDPALSGREKLRKALPVLHQQVAQMHQMAQELSTLPPPENRHEVSREMIESALSDSGLKVQTLSVNEGTVRAQFAGVEISALQAWLLALQKSGGLFVDEIKITGQSNGLVSATVTIRQSMMNTDN